MLTPPVAMHQPPFCVRVRIYVLLLMHRLDPNLGEENIAREQHLLEQSERLVRSGVVWGGRARELVGESERLVRSRVEQSWVAVSWSSLLLLILLCGVGAKGFGDPQKKRTPYSSPWVLVFYLGYWILVLDFWYLVRAL